MTEKQELHAKIFQLIKQAKSVPCQRCDKRYPTVCMDFDHLPEETKLINIGSPKYWTSVSRIEREIQKCQVLCSNCHRIVTWERKYGREVESPAEPDKRPGKNIWRRVLTGLLGVR